MKGERPGDPGKIWGRFLPKPAQIPDSSNSWQIIAAPGVFKSDYDLTPLLTRRGYAVGVQRFVGNVLLFFFNRILKICSYNFNASAKKSIPICCNPLPSIIFTHKTTFWIN